MSVLPPAAAPGVPAVGDITELYRALSGRLEQIVRNDVGASDSVVEDACQFAWDRLLLHRDRIHSDTALSWLARTAVREAVKLLRRERRHVSLEAVIAVAGEGDIAGRQAGPEELVLQRERLEAVGHLPDRQQRIVWLHAVGLSYAEIAIRTGCTLRTVERQLLRAKRTMRAVDGPWADANQAQAAQRPAVHSRRSALAA